jgi:DNA polymerase III subunit beta
MLSANTAEKVEVSLDRGQVIFQLPDQRLTTRLLDGQYPNYGQLIPESFIRTADLERKSFLNALERISVLADQKNHIVRMDFASTGILTLSVDAPDVGSGKEQLEIRYTGEDLTIAFNVKYLLEGLRVIQASDIKLLFNGPVNPAVLKPIDGSDFSYLVMPVHLRN